MYTVVQARDVWDRRTTDSHLVLQLFDLPLLPIGDEARGSSKHAHSMCQKANTPGEKRPLNPPYGAQKQVCDKQGRHHNYEGSKVDVKTGEFGHSLLCKGQLPLLVHDFRRSRSTAACLN